MSLILGLSIFVVLMSFMCSLLEAVFLSISPAYVALIVKEGKRYGILLEHLKENVNKPISAILTMNTISNTLGSALIATTAYEKFGNLGVSIISAVLTFAILVFAEIIPKILGTVYWKQLAATSAYFIQIIIFLLYPIVWLSETLGRALSQPDAVAVTREEMIATAELGVEEGSLHKKESAIIKNLLTLNSLFVSDIMTPRSVFFALDCDMTVEEVHQKYRPIRFSRIPVYDSTLDNIIGMTMRYRIHEALSNDQHDLKIREITTPIQSVPERMTVAAVLDLLIKRKEHLALAVDEYGIVTGLVTLEDAVETLLGVEIVDELDHVTDMRQYALEQWQIRKNQLRRS
jgi:CBS domain containing-hemolysin-like protein